MSSAVELIKEFQENLTKYVGVINSDHAYIHKGIGFAAVIDVGTISGAYNISFKTPSVASGKFIHWRPIGITSSANYCKLQLYEGDTYTGGDAVTPVNLNRLSDKTSLMQAFVKNSTSTPGGTIIKLSGMGTSGNPSARSGGATASSEEIVLKQNTIYTMVITPAGETVVTAELFWYEENCGIEEGNI